jgi:hypothetical protein
METETDIAVTGRAHQGPVPLRTPPLRRPGALGRPARRWTFPAITTPVSANHLSSRYDSRPWVVVAQ